MRMNNSELKEENTTPVISEVDINVEETTSISEQPFFQTITDSVEELKKGFKEPTPSDDIDVVSNNYDATITSALDLINSPTESINYVWEKLFPEGELCVIYGDSAGGKSMLARCILFAIAYGMEEYLGFKIDLPPERRKVCLVITEDSEKSIKTLLQKQAQYFEQFRTIDEPIFDVISSCEKGIVHTLQERIKDVLYSIIVVDTPQDDIEGSMNDNNVVRAYLNQLSSIGTKNNCTIVCIHHKTKYSNDRPPSKEDLSGTRAFGDKPRSVFEIRRHLEEDYSIYLTPVKANYEDNSFLRYSMKLIMDPKTLTFSFNNEYYPSNEIHLSVQKKDNTKAIKEKIIELRAFNPTMSQEKIAEILNEEFQDESFSQSKVSKIMNPTKKIDD